MACANRCLWITSSPTFEVHLAPPLASNRESPIKNLTSGFQGRWDSDAKMGTHIPNFSGGGSDGTHGQQFRRRRPASWQTFAENTSALIRDRVVSRLRLHSA